MRIEYRAGYQGEDGERLLFVIPLLRFIRQHVPVVHDVQRCRVRGRRVGGGRAGLSRQRADWVWFLLHGVGVASQNFTSSNSDSDSLPNSDSVRRQHRAVHQQHHHQSEWSCNNKQHGLRTCVRVMLKQLVQRLLSPPVRPAGHWGDTHSQP